LQEDNIDKQNFSPSVMKLADKILGNYLIYSDDHLIAINKPTGLATQGGSKITLSVDDAISYLNQQGNDYRLVHRLDKETSGVLLIAKNYLAAHKLTNAFKEKIINKIYIAITLGKPLKDEGEISNFISKNRGGTYETIKEDKENGKLAVTQYKLLKFSEDLGLIEFMPKTGRTHQLRFHAQKLGCPIIGDSKYGSQISKTYSEQMLLHAQKIILPEQLFGTQIIIEAKLPYYFEQYKKIL
jgi:23S rRNA pseudouridine955/2504/2580 synthase